MREPLQFHRIDLTEDVAADRVGEAVGEEGEGDVHDAAVDDDPEVVEFDAAEVEAPTEHGCVQTQPVGHRAYAVCCIADTGRGERLARVGDGQRAPQPWSEGRRERSGLQPHRSPPERDTVMVISAFSGDILSVRG